MSDKRWSSIFFGTPEFSLPSLKECFENSNLKAIVSQPDRPRGRGQKTTPSPVKKFGIDNKIPVFTPASLKKDSPDLEKLKSFMKENPVDFFLVVAYGNLLPNWTLKTPSVSCLNVHASLLPRWRGAAPIQRALESGDSVTGVCLQMMQMELDAGNVVCSRKLLIKNKDNAFTLSEQLSDLGGSLVKDFLENFAQPELVATAQNPKLITWAPKISKEEGFWKSNWSAIETHNKIRAFCAWPGVRAAIPNFGIIKLIESGLEPHYEGANCRVGEVRLYKGQVILGCEKDSRHNPELLLDKVQPPNKGVMKAFDFFQNLLHAKGSGQNESLILKPLE